MFYKKPRKTKKSYQAAAGLAAGPPASLRGGRGGAPGALRGSNGGGGGGQPGGDARRTLRLPGGRRRRRGQTGRAVRGTAASAAALEEAEPRRSAAGVLR